MWGGRIRIGRVLAGVAIICAIGAFGVFAWRVTHYARLIRSGELDPSQLAFLSAYTPSSIAASIPLTGTSTNVATSDDPSLGGAKAVITIVEFADFGCPYSREASFTVRSAALKYGDKVKFVYRDFPITELHPLAEMAAQAANCAGDQGKFWEYHDKIYANQSVVSANELQTFARALNLNEATFRSCLASGKYAKEVAADFADGVAAGVKGTPTFFVNGTMIPGSIPADVLDALIQRALK